MNHIEAGVYWNNNAEAWTTLARAGYDTYRDHLNTPAFFKSLPEIKGLNGVDIGCGEGYNTRLLAQRGAHIDAIDISDVFIRHALNLEREKPLGIKYQVASAVELPFSDQKFDFATAFMSLMDIPESDLAIREAYRVLKPRGFLQFSITHPCFDTLHRKNLRNRSGITYAIEIGRYFEHSGGEIDEWIFGTAPLALRKSLRNFRSPRFTRTLSEWMNALLSTGFVLEFMHEPYPSDDTVSQHQALQDAQTVAYFLHVRCRKPG